MHKQRNIGQLQNFIYRWLSRFLL